MRQFRILYIEDQPDIRELVEILLGLDPQLTLRTCAPGPDAITEASSWSPDLILCDVMMPVMDGPETLARLRQSPRTSEIPVIFTTACAQARELERFMSLGGNGVITKPFDPMTFADTVRGHLQVSQLSILGRAFRERLRADSITLAECRAALRSDATSSSFLEDLQTCAHKLAGAAGIYGFPKVSCAASALEESIIERRADHGAARSIETELDALIANIECELGVLASRLKHVKMPTDVAVDTTSATMGCKSR